MKAAVPVFIALSACQPTDPSDTDSAPKDTDLAQDTAAPKDTGEPPFVIENPLSFSEPTVVLETPGNAKTPSIAALSDGSVHVVWHDFSSDPANLYHGIWQDSAWTAKPLPLHPEKSIRPQLLVQDETLHLLFDVSANDSYTVHHATYTSGAWSEAVAVATGSQSTMALDPSGRLHAIYFVGSDLAHSRRVDEQWVTGDPIPTWSSVNPFGHRALTSADGITVAAATGDCSSMICYDITLLDWNAEGWTSSTLHKSWDLSSDEPEGALMPDGSQAWTWAEQVPYEPWITAIVFASALDQNPVMVFEDPAGFSSEPAVVVPPDGVPMVSWLAPGNRVMMDRYPFGEPTLLFEDAMGADLTVDGSGYTHIVTYGYDALGSQQIWHTTNRLD